MAEAAYVFGSFQLVPARRRLLDGGRPVPLGSRALDILTVLVEAAGKTVPNDEIMARAWPTTTVEESSLRVHIGALRKALGEGRGGNRFIANVPGRGYTFVAPMTRGQNLPQVSAPEAAPSTGNLPTPLASIIGRQETIAALGAQLARHRLVTIVGPGGIGKTTVAIAAADNAAASYPDGVWFAALAPLANPGLVASTIAAMFGLSSAGGDPMVALTAWLGDKQALIVLDTCEHVLDAAAAVAEGILRSAPGVAILATSREPLRAEGEWLNRLPPLALPPTQSDITASEALEHSSVQLFQERVLATGGDFALSDADAPVICEICRTLDGLPLALELAAVQAEFFGIRGLAQGLNDRFAFLVTGRRTALPRQQTLRATIDWSYGLLPASEQIVLRRLSIFRGDFTMEAVCEVVGDADLSKIEVVDSVANLAAKSLVTTDIGGDVTHHWLLDTTRAYAIEKLSDRGECEALSRRHAEYYRNLFERAEGEAAARPADKWLADYAREIDNLRAALDWAFSPGGDGAIGVALTAAAVPLWMRLSLPEECRGRAEQALAALGPGASRNAHHEMKLHAVMGASAIYSGGPASPEISTAYTRTLEIAESLDDAEYRLQALWGLWVYHSAGGGNRVAVELAQRFHGLAAERPDPKDRVSGQGMIGASQYFLGDLTSARRHLEHAHAGYVAPDQRSHIVRFQTDQREVMSGFLARVLWLLGFPDQATRTADSAAENAHAADHTISLCQALTHAACPLALLTGDSAAAERYSMMLLDHSTRSGLAFWRAWGRSFQGVLIIQHGDVITGLRLVRAGIDEIGDAGFAIFRLIAILMAGSLVGAGQNADGVAAIEETIARYERTEERWAVAEMLRIKGELLLLQGSPGAEAAAANHFRQALDCARRQGALSWELRAATSLARLLRNRGCPADAIACLQPVYDRFTEGFDTADLKAAKTLLDQLG